MPVLFSWMFLSSFFRGPFFTAEVLWKGYAPIESQSHYISERDGTRDLDTAKMTTLIPNQARAH